MIWKLVSKFSGRKCSPVCSPLLTYLECFQQQYLRKEGKNAWVHFPPRTGTFFNLENCLSIGYEIISMRMEKRMDSNPRPNQIVQIQPFLKQKSITRKQNDGFWCVLIWFFRRGGGLWTQCYCTDFQYFVRGQIGGAPKSAPQKKGALTFD